MNSSTIAIGNGAGFWGDRTTAPRELCQAAELDYLTLEYLAELTMSILAHQRSRDAELGYARDVVEVIESLLPQLAGSPRLRIVTNAGGVHPAACARAVSRLLAERGGGELRVAVVGGDDLLPDWSRLQSAGWTAEHLDTGEPLNESRADVAVANAYLGAAPIVAALEQDARIVITGRVADASLTVGPAVHHFGWSWDDWNRLAGATVAGHLIECGAQVTGGYSQRWRQIDLTHVGYPIAELSADGSAVITKAPGSGGCVDGQTVVEQLVYEIGDPRAYLTPDVTADFTTVEVEDLGQDRVRVHGATGTPPPPDYKVSLARRAGFTSSGLLLVAGEDCRDKAQACGQMILDRLAAQGDTFARSRIEVLGSGRTLPGSPVTAAPGEVMLRIAVADADRGRVARFTRELAPLITSGPAGLAGYTAGRSPVRPLFAFWPTRIARELVQVDVRVQSAAEWCST